ncbi:hypothetical protein CLOM_g14877 [Closterium sp. NIES-68]|nr:hypothetical protein CLOM_g14877 [Closterium sp. NIES-68]GJP75563.1 hypothetical protein CLOP_g5995 [Closterium sp. NIES-67]
MRTSALLVALVLLSALLLAANAVPERASALEKSRRILSHNGDDDRRSSSSSNSDSSCLKKFKTSQYKCNRDHKCCDSERDGCTRRKSCAAKAYQKYKTCVYGDSSSSKSDSSWDCNDWCKYIKKQCKSDDEDNCDRKYKNCHDNDCS